MAKKKSKVRRCGQSKGLRGSKPEATGTLTGNSIMPIGVLEARTNTAHSSVAIPPSLSSRELESALRIFAEILHMHAKLPGGSLYISMGKPAHGRWPYEGTTVVFPLPRDVQVISISKR